MQKVYILYENFSDNGYRAREAYSTLQKATEGMEKWIKTHYSPEDEPIVRKERLVYVDDVDFKG